MQTNYRRSLSGSCYNHIRDVRRIRDTIDFTNASSIATSINHSRVDDYNSVRNSLPVTQLKRLQQIQNTLASAIIRTPKNHISLLYSNHGSRSEKQRPTTQILYITHNLLRQCEPTYLLISPISNALVKLAPLTTSVSPFHHSPLSLNSMIAPSVIPLPLSVELSTYSSQIILSTLTFTYDNHTLSHSSFHSLHSLYIEINSYLALRLCMLIHDWTPDNVQIPVGWIGLYKAFNLFLLWMMK